MPAAGPKSLSSVTSLTVLDRSSFTAELDGKWSVASKIHGGYLVALAARAAAASAEPAGLTEVAPLDVLVASSQFCRAPKPGPIALRTREIRRSKSYTVISVEVVQEEGVCLNASFTLGVLSTEPKLGFRWDAGVPARPVTRFDEAVRLRPPPSLMPVDLFEQVDVRIDPDSLGFMSLQPSGKGEIRGWVSLPDGESFDSWSLHFAVDALPPATYDVEFTGWVPTVQLTSFVRARPAPGPVQVVHRAHLIDGGLVDETCHVWDVAGRLVAQGTQIAAHRPGASKR